MRPAIEANRIMLARHYESAGRHEDAQAIAQEMLFVRPEIMAERGTRFWRASGTGSGSRRVSKEQLRSAGLP